MRTKSKIINGIACLVLSISLSKAAVIDIGFTLGTVEYQSSVLTGQLIEVGTFSGYNDTLGLGFFSGKSQATLLASFTSFAPQTGSSNFFEGPSSGSPGLFYGTFELGAASANQRVFAWIYSGTTTASPAWAILSGTIGGTTTYDTAWFTVANDNPLVNVVEAATTNTVIYSSTPAGASMVGDGSAANLVLVPEPSTGALMMIGAAGLVALRRLRKV